MSIGIYGTSLVVIGNLPTSEGDAVDPGLIHSREDPLQKEMATHSSMPKYFSILAWEIPWIEEPRGLQSMVYQRIRCDWVTEHSCIGIFTEMTGDMKNEAKIEKKKQWFISDWINWL